VLATVEADLKPCRAVRLRLHMSHTTRTTLEGYEHDVYTRLKWSLDGDVRDSAGHVHTILAHRGE
jgi:hypothetical protein